MIWVLEDPRAGTAAQALGLAERLGQPFRRIPLGWSRWAGLPMPFASLAALDAPTRALFRAPWPGLAISAGRRSAAVSRWLRARGVRTVHCMRPGFAARDFDMLVLGRHDAPRPAANILPILGALHRASPRSLAEARVQWAEFSQLPAPRVALLLGGPVRAAEGGPGLEPAIAERIALTAGALGRSVLATTSRRTGQAAAQAVAEALDGHPHVLFQWGDAGQNPFPGLLAHADAVVVSADSVSMLSEALMTRAPIFLAQAGELGPRHRALADSLVTAGHAQWLTPGATLFSRAALDETGRVAAAIKARGWL